MRTLLGCLLVISAGAGFANDDAAEANRLNNLAFRYYAQRNYAEAAPLARRAMAIWEKLDPEGVNFALSLNNLAVVLEFTSQHKQTEPLLKRSLAMMESELSGTDPRIASVLNNLAAFNQRKGKEAAARDYYLRSLEILQKAYGPEDGRVKAVLKALAAIGSRTPRAEIRIGGPDSTEMLRRPVESDRGTRR